MSITPVSRKAFAVGAECPESGRAYGITVDPLPDGTLKLVWAFMIDRAKARREGLLHLLRVRRDGLLSRRVRSNLSGMRQAGRNQGFRRV